MEKEFIPYEQALALKELGFDEPCLTQSKHKKLCSNKEQPGGCQLHNLHCAYPDCTIDKTVESIPLPLYQQVFRWFREKYGLYSHVRESLAFDKTLEFVTQINGSYVNHGIEDKPINRFETYEEAELECLKKLIEIVKEK